MKKLFLISFLILGITTFYSCKEKEKLILEDVTASVLTSSASGDIVLLKEDTLETFATFQWTESEANLDISMSYQFEMDTAGNNFSEPITIEFSDPFIYSTTVKEFNAFLLAEGFVQDEVNALEFRITTNISGLDSIYSNILALNVTPYADVVDYGNVYLLGSATTPGWNNATALPLEHIGDGVFQITTTLTSGANMYFKFIAVLGQWAPQWGTDASGTWDAGTLVYRPTEAVPDPPAIPAPPTTGSYKITADIPNLNYTVVAAK